jgi:hypothetical protein
MLPVFTTNKAAVNTSKKKNEEGKAIQNKKCQSYIS